LKSKSVPLFERVRGSNESSFVGEKDLFEVQDRTPCRRGEGDLREPEAQAAAGMRPEGRNSKIEIRKSGQEDRDSESNFEFRFSNFVFRFSTEVMDG
jgi:hypothetical protein